MAFSWFSCKPCIEESDLSPTKHTVEVNSELFDKENVGFNVPPLRQAGKNAEELVEKSVLAPNAQDQPQREIEEEKAARQRKEAEAARKREEAERAAAEKARRKAEKAAKSEADKAARKDALRLAEEKKAREDEAARAAAAAAALAVQQECARRATEERRRSEVNEAEAKVAAWCKTNGFDALNTPKKTFRGNTKFPLHTAVKNNNQDIIKMMLLAGVQKDAQDSKGETPLQLASKLNQNRSHDQIVAMLR